ncbi:hypothetical protein P9112_003168 [Eukaryota sp. TZLM1-RC]
MPCKRDIAWDYIIELSCDDSDSDCTINLDLPEVIAIEKNYTHQCVYCSLKYTPGSSTRIKDHSVGVPPGERSNISHFGYDAPELQKQALRVVSQFVSASAVERLWSLHDWIHSKRRNRLTEKRVDKLISVYNFLTSGPQEEDCEEDNKTEECIEVLNVCC